MRITNKASRLIKLPAFIAVATLAVYASYFAITRLADVAAQQYVSIIPTFSATIPVTDFTELQDAIEGPVGGEDRAVVVTGVGISLIDTITIPTGRVITLLSDGNYTLDGGSLTGTAFVVAGILNLGEEPPQAGQNGILTISNVDSGSPWGVAAISVLGGEFNMYSGVIVGNRRGVDVSSGGQFLMSGGVIQENDGSGVSIISSDASFEMTSGEIIGNIAEQGGGVWSVGEFIMSGGTIAGNTASTDQGGGGVFIQGGQFTMYGGSISGNIGNRDGGGVFVDAGEFVMSGGEIASNETARGGGVFVNTGGEFSMISGQINGHSIPGGGGGVMVDVDGIFQMSGDAIINNNSAWVGGGVNLHGGNFIMDGGEITDNSAAGGGAVFLSDNSIFTMNAGVLSENQATLSDGGAVYFNGGTFTMFGGQIIDNIANRNGGGVFVARQSIFNIQGAGTKEIFNNRAANGGGVYVAVEAELNAETITFSGNTAEQNGGAIFTEDYEYEVEELSVGSYSNLSIGAGVVFLDNRAAKAYVSPINAISITGIPAGSQSIGAHPINNFDINFIGFEEIILPPDTGGESPGAPSTGVTSQTTGATGSYTALLVIITGVIGALISTVIFRQVRPRTVRK